MFSTHIENGTCFANAGAELTIYSAAEDAVQLRQVIQAHPNIVFNLSAVEEIDTAGLQLLMQAKRTIEANGHRPRFASASPAIQEIVQLLKLHDFFIFEDHVNVEQSLPEATP